MFHILVGVKLGEKPAQGKLYLENRFERHRFAGQSHRCVMRHSVNLLQDGSFQCFRDELWCFESVKLIVSQSLLDRSEVLS